MVLGHCIMGHLPCEICMFVESLVSCQTFDQLLLNRLTRATSDSPQGNIGQSMDSIGVLV
jgi:hypothetical protein